MTLTFTECKLLINMFNASIERASKSGIPIGAEYYKDIETIKDKLYQEMSMIIRKEEKNDTERDN